MEIRGSVRRQNIVVNEKKAKKNNEEQRYR
jgi:hypothetical protein